MCFKLSTAVFGEFCVIRGEAGVKQNQANAAEQIKHRSNQKAGYGQSFYKKYNNRKGAANLYLRCSIFFKHHSPLYEAFYAGMAALTEENYQEAARQFARAHSINPLEPRCLQNLRYVEAKLKEQKK